MVTPLEVCTEGEQRAVIRVLWSEDVSEPAIHRELSAQYENSVLPQRSVYKWTEKFKNGRLQKPVQCSLFLFGANL